MMTIQPISHNIGRVLPTALANTLDAPKKIQIENKPAPLLAATEETNKSLFGANFKRAFQTVIFSPGLLIEDATRANGASRLTMGEILIINIVCAPLTVPAGIIWGLCQAAF